MFYPSGLSAADSCGAAGWLAALGGSARALVMLLIPVAWVPGCLGAAMGMQLPPLQHLALHGLTLLLLARRAPTGACRGTCCMRGACRESMVPWTALCDCISPILLPTCLPLVRAACAQYVGLQPCSGKVVGAAYKVLQSAISLVAPGSNRRLAAAAETASDVQQCTAVAWARSTTARRRIAASPASAIRSKRNGGMMQASGFRPSASMPDRRFTRLPLSTHRKNPFSLAGRVATRQPPAGVFPQKSKGESLSCLPIPEKHHRGSIPPTRA